MKILKQNQQVLIIQRGTKIGFLLGISFVMLALLVIILLVLYSISISLNLGGWGLLFLPLAVWLFWLALHRFLTNDKIVTVYNFDKGRNKATIEFQGLWKFRTVDFPLDKIRSVEVKFIGAQNWYRLRTSPVMTTGLQGFGAIFHEISLSLNSFSTVIFVSQINISLFGTIKGLNQELETKHSRLLIF